MTITTRRQFLKCSLAAGLAFGFRGWVSGASRPSKPAGANDLIRIAVIGLGATEAIGGVGGRGHQLIARLRQVPGVRIVALCDVDRAHLDREAQLFGKRGEEVSTHIDLRRVFEDATIDAVVIATPNHWHALATVWACQAGKDVYVEKPFAYNLWEGRQMVAAAKKHGRMVQVGTQNRSSPLLRRVFDDLRRGELGSLRVIHALVYRPREGIGKVSSPTPPPASVDYDLWCGPAPSSPLTRKQLHYEWHWFWATGNGEMGNNGVHVIDLGRWALRHNQPPPRAISIGGRFAFNDCGETANTQIALLDYQPAPLICEIRNVVASQGRDAIGKYQGRTGGLVIECEGGYFAGDASGGALFDLERKKIKDIPNDGSSERLEALHLDSFFRAVRTRKTGDLAADALQGHLSTAGCHMANISHRLGKQFRPEDIRDRIRNNHQLAEAFGRCQEYLRQNGVDLGATPATVGPWVTFDPKRECFVDDFAPEANALSERSYRPPFEVPKLA